MEMIPQGGPRHSSTVVSFNMDDTFGLPEDLIRILPRIHVIVHLVQLGGIPKDQVHIPDGHCRRCRCRVRCLGTQDRHFGGSGSPLGWVGCGDGHIAFNEPYSSLESG